MNFTQTLLPIARPTVALSEFICKTDDTVIFIHEKLIKFGYRLPAAGDATAQLPPRSAPRVLPKNAKQVRCQKDHCIEYDIITGSYTIVRTEAELG